MRRMLLVVGSLFLLACAGVGESVLEGVTGQEIDIREDGMDVTLPEGGTASMSWGGAATHHASIPFTAPPDSQVVLSGEIAFPGRMTSHYVTYETTVQTEAAMLQRYRQEMTAMGLTPTEEPIEGGVSLNAERDGTAHFVTVTDADPIEAVQITFGVGSIEDIQQGMAINPG